MKIGKLIYVLYKMRVLSPAGIYRLLAAIGKYGVNVMTLLSFAEQTYGDKEVLVDEYETLSYRQLLSQSEKLSMALKEKYHLKIGQKVGFLCKNHASLVKAIFAVSLLGADIYLLNAEMSRNQFEALLQRYDFDFLLYDVELRAFVEESSYKKEKLLSYHREEPAVNNLLAANLQGEPKLQRVSMGKLVILTGGTTGNFKAAAHKPSLFNFLNPFVTLLTRLKLLRYNTAYIATPIYHGYGVAVLFLFMALGKKMVIHRGFEAKKACSLIREHNVEVVTVVPLMVHRMLQQKVEDLRSLACIVSGGAELNPKLVEDTQRQLGDVLCNLYGTSEAGLNMVATPQDLRYSPKTIGNKIKGVQLKILDANKKEVPVGTVGQFCIKNGWSMKNSKTDWIETGDLGYQDHKGYFFLCGRADDMVVSGGENVYPIEVEQILKNHPLIEDAAVIGVHDEIFGQRLKAFVLPVKEVVLTEEELSEWLRSKVARYQVPREIVFVDMMPYTILGKLDKKKLK